MFYTVNARTGLIMETSETCPDPQEEANHFQDPVYIIQGQHTGLTAEPMATDQTAVDREQTDILVQLATWMAG